MKHGDPHEAPLTGCPDSSAICRLEVVAMTREAMLAVVAKVAAAVEGPAGISQVEYRELRHALERVAADPALPIDVGEVIDTALIWLWTLANRPHAVADGGRDELRSRLSHDLALLQRLIEARGPERA